MKSGIKWIGFDMDECLGTLYPLYAYCEELMNLLQDDFTRNSLYIDIIDILSEQIFIHKNHNLWIFRPNFDIVLDMLIEAYKNQQITGCFILSNNGSSSLVSTAQLLLNTAVAKKTGNLITNLFHEAWSAKASCRKNSFVKSWNVTQSCLKSANLPTMENPKTDLLFFDDKLHPLLKKELGSHFIQVSPYFNYTPYQNVFSILKPLFDKHNISNDQRQHLKTYAEAIEKEDMNLVFNDTPFKKEEQYSLKTPSIKIRQQISEFTEPIFKFLAIPPKVQTSAKNMLFQKTIRTRDRTKTSRTPKTTGISIKRTPQAFKTSIRRKNRRDSLWSRY